MKNKLQNPLCSFIQYMSPSYYLLINHSFPRFTSQYSIWRATGTECAGTLNLRCLREDGPHRPTVHKWQVIGSCDFVYPCKPCLVGRETHFRHVFHSGRPGTTSRSGRHSLLPLFDRHFASRAPPGSPPPAAAAAAGAEEAVGADQLQQGGNGGRASTP